MVYAIVLINLHNFIALSAQAVVIMDSQGGNQATPQPTEKAKKMKTKSKIKMAVFAGTHGDPDFRGSIWLDLDRGGDKWAALIESKDAAEALANNTGAELVDVTDWDGERFGDGQYGTVEQYELGVIVVAAADLAAVKSVLPSDWCAIDTNQAYEMAHQ